MVNLPTPVGWAEVATRAEVAALGNSLRGEISMLRSEVRGEIPGPGVEMAVLLAEMRADRAELLFKLFFGMVISNAILVILVLAVLNLA